VIKITNLNFIELEDFYFTKLAAKLSNFHPSINFKERAAETKQNRNNNKRKTKEKQNKNKTKTKQKQKQK
jgi:hypothetical protein